MKLEEKVAEIQKKLDKEYPGYSDAVNGMTLSELKEALTVMSKNIEEIKLAREGDNKLEDAKALVTELEAPYKEALKKSEIRLKFMSLLLKLKTDEK